MNGKRSRTFPPLVAQEASTRGLTLTAINPWVVWLALEGGYQDMMALYRVLTFFK